jgi:uncharacterized protein
MHYILFYNFVPDYPTKRTPFREEHLKLLQDAYKRQELVLAGAFAEPADGAVLVFRSQEAAENIVKIDPYVKNGLVTKSFIRKWTTVIGDDVK